MRCEFDFDKIRNVVTVAIKLY